MVVKIAEGDLKTKFGSYRELLFYDGRGESIVLVMGQIENEDEILCRVHSSCISGHYFNSLECDCQQQMELTQQLIQKEGRGIIILLDQEGKGNGHFAWLKRRNTKWFGFTKSESYEAIGFKKDARDYTVAAEILEYLRVNSVRMMTNSRKKAKQLEILGVEVVGIESIETNGEKID